MRDNFSKSVALSLSIPIFNRFSTRNAVRQAELDLQDSRWQLESTRKALYKEQKSSTTIVKEKKIYPNDPCPCGSGKKYKKCCGRNK